MEALALRGPTAAPVAGRFGRHGGRFVPEPLIPACEEVEAAFAEAWADPGFRGDLAWLLSRYAGRPTPLTPAVRLSAELGVTVLLKREDLAHTGSHKINNVLGQALLARRMGKRRLIAETGAGMHGVATATAGALLGLPVTVFMGERDVERQAHNVFRMRLLGAQVVPVRSGSRTLKDATSEAMRHWVSATEDAYYCVGSVIGPHPYPWLVRELQAVIGQEARHQCAEQLSAGTPDQVVACVGGGSNAAGTFAGFVDTPARLVGVEAAGGAGAALGEVGVLHGFQSLFLQDEQGQIREARSVAAGLDYPGVGPEHAHLRDLGRAEYVTATDEEALAAAVRLARAEGIVPAIESAHALAWVVRAAGTTDLPTGSSVLVTLSGRGDKDIATLTTYLGDEEAR
ncbi:tryptophan synthase subunit beta [Verrucosispora sioxanthis]|uniref:Tryptophan synthase beta chain n=1 Tax=Verrucosispora sioxanthis TaxID=2499994 RepID=A0A6M1KS05_9ACTN|nr:tryptophan synthase subunit beta [Verrucosispora sioxanthis]NEE62366.1 tryptophan synthase subunit beta [Verrucosispora sioxanthis]NGM11476.1 tryptophan synthase subunit beta [Verrucosispora sioxanthis]